MLTDGSGLRAMASRIVTGVVVGGASCGEAALSTLRRHRGRGYRTGTGGGRPPARRAANGDYRVGSCVRGAHSGTPVRFRTTKPDGSGSILEIRSALRRAARQTRP